MPDTEVVMSEDLKFFVILAGDRLRGETTARYFRSVSEWLRFIVGRIAEAVKRKDSAQETVSSEHSSELLGPRASRPLTLNAT